MTKSIRTTCISCEKETNQTVLFKKAVPGYSKGDLDEFYTVQCRGCDTVSFLHVARFKFGKREKPTVIHNNYPETDFLYGVEFDFLPEEDQQQLPKQIAALYEEITDAFESNSSILAGLGLRTLVEAVCIEQGIKGDNLLKKIQGLHSNGLISSTELPILDKLRLIGNYSAHQVRSLPMDKLNYALSIINHILKSIYILPKINKRLKLE